MTHFLISKASLLHFGLDSPPDLCMLSRKWDKGRHCPLANAADALPTAAGRIFL